jgi:peptidyl-tRNA hydrolase
MKKIVLLCLLVPVLKNTHAQSFAVEILTGHEHIFYQQGISKKFSSNSRFGLTQVASYISRYNTDKDKKESPHEIMNQLHITASLNRSFSLLTGMFYTNATGISVSAALQFVYPIKNGVVVLIPRADIRRHGSFELMAMLEYSPAIKNGLKLYTRLQAMSNAGPYQHNRSWQRLRIGVDLNGTQLGVGLNLDEYGKNGKIKINSGVFIRKLIF